MPTEGPGKFRGHEEVVEWIKAHVPESTDPTEDAIWWVCYRETEALIDDTVKHIAQALRHGTAEYTTESVDNFIDGWCDDEGTGREEGGNIEQIDAAIEADLNRFFGQGGR